MELLLIRHGIAEDAETFARAGGRDEDRPLTAAGLRRLRQAMPGLRGEVARLDALASSALLRARQTAAVLAEAYGLPPAAALPGLAPDDDPAAALPWLERLSGGAAAALVGHAPHLGRFAGLLLCGEPQPLLALRKGGAALIAFEGVARAGGGVLQWALTPRQLRGLGG